MNWSRESRQNWSRAAQPHEKWLPGRGFLRDREIRLFGFVRLLLVAVLTLASAGMLRQALPHSQGTYG